MDRHTLSLIIRHTAYVDDRDNGVIPLYEILNQKRRAHLTDFVGIKRDNSLSTAVVSSKI